MCGVLPLVCFRKNGTGPVRYLKNGKTHFGGSGKRRDTISNSLSNCNRFLHRRIHRSRTFPFSQNRFHRRRSRNLQQPEV
jgi:hypothetical protein